MILYVKKELDSENKYRLFTYFKCDYCADTYKRHSRFLKGAVRENYCSSACYNEDLIRIKVNCAHCGVLFSKVPSKTTKSGLHFCCREHKDAAQSYMPDIQPDHYGKGNNYRVKALKELPNECRYCGYNNVDALEVHHIDKNRDNNDISNLEIVCANCHTLIHKGKLYGTAS